MAAETAHTVIDEPMPAIAAGQDEFDALFADEETTDAPTTAQMPGATAIPAPSSPSPQVAPDDQEIEIAGQRVKLSALKTTHQQFQYLQQKHLTAKPFLDWIDRHGLQTAHLPVVEALLRQALTPSASPQAASPASDPRQEKWFKDLAEYYPDVANEMLAFMQDVQAKATRVDQLEQALGRLAGATTQRQQQEAAATELSAFAKQVESLTGVYTDLKTADHRAQFVQYLVLKNPLIEQLRDPEFLEAMYLRFNRDGIAKQLTLQAQEAKAKQAATAAAGFGEGGTGRGPTTGARTLAQEIADLLGED